MTSLALVSLLAVSCSVSTHEPGAVTSPDAGDDQRSANLRLDPYPQTTPYATVKVSGQGPAYGSLLVDTPIDGEMSRSLPADGTFCLDIELRPNENNTITLGSIDEMGNYSQVHSLEVLREGTPPDGDDGDRPPVLSNVAEGATEFDVGGSVRDGGDISTVTDGDEIDHVRVRNSSGDDDYLSIRLTRKLPIVAVRFLSGRHPDGDCRAKGYDIYAHSDAVPSQGNPEDGGGWQKLEEVRNAGEEQVSDDLGGYEAAWISFYFKDGGCRPGTLGFLDPHSYRIREIEVMGERPEDDPTANEGQTCLNGG